MTLVRSTKSIGAAGLALGLLWGSSAAAITVDGNSTYNLNDGAVLDTTITDEQSAFSKEFAINSDETLIGGETYGTGQITLGEISVLDGAFQFAYDIQETGNDPYTDIADIIIEVDGTEVWSYTGELLGIQLGRRRSYRQPAGQRG